MTFCLFSSCERSVCDVKTSSWFELMLFFNFFRMVCFSYSFRLFDNRTLNLSSTFVSTLFTFCPPAPLLRAVLKTTSFKSFSSLPLMYVNFFVVNLFRLPSVLFSVQVVLLLSLFAFFSTKFLNCLSFQALLN